MKNMKKIKYFAAFLILSSSIFTSCNIAGLDFQKDEKYDAQNVTNKIDMTVWEFINSRPDIFSTLIEGIKYAGIEDLYKEPNNTYILLTNTALSDWEANSYCYWNRVKVTSTTSGRAAAWEQYSQTQVAELLRYHILKGEYSYFNLTSTPLWVKTKGNGTFEYTKDGQTLEGDTAVMALKVAMDRSLPLHLNNYAWNYRGVLDDTKSAVRTSNIHAKDGYIQVTDYYLERPTRTFMGY